MLIYVDVDGTLCTQTDDYYSAEPIQERINKVNILYEAGHTIVIYTARGSVRKDRLGEYIQLTKSQLKKWGVKYNQLDIGNKPPYDLLIDDRNISLSEFDKENFS